MHAADIQAALRKAGVTQASVAEETGLTAGLVSSVIHGRWRNDKVAKAIGRATRIPVRKLFPSNNKTQNARRPSTAKARQ